MATWTKQPASCRGESRRCRWYSSRALALGLMPRVESKPQTIAIVLGGDVSANTFGARAAGPPG